MSAPGFVEISRKKGRIAGFGSPSVPLELLWCGTNRPRKKFGQRIAALERGKSGIHGRLAMKLHVTPRRERGEGAASVGAAKAETVGRASLDHKAAILALYAGGYSPCEIRRLMLEHGYFEGKSKKQVLPFIYSVLRRREAKTIEASRPKPPSRVDEMMRLVEQPKKRFML